MNLDKWTIDKDIQLNRIEAKLDTLLAKKKRKPRASKSAYPDWFEVIMKHYPKRVGSNPKKRAYSAATARDSEEPSLTAMDMGAQRYAAFCDATGKTGTEYVMMAATFFGPEKHYENDWEIPKQERSLSNMSMLDLEAYAVENKLHLPGGAPQNIQNVYQYRVWIEGKMK